MRVSQQEFVLGNIVNIHHQDWLEKQRVAGKITAQTLSLLESYVNSKTDLSLLELNKIAETFIYDNHCTPTFKNYKGFPYGVCCSVNKVLTHGMPSDYYLKEGDLISFDLGATFQGAIADSALTCIFGTPNPNHLKLVQATKKSLELAIQAIIPGIQSGIIGNTIYKYAKSQGFYVITEYGGHHISWNMPHAPPFVSNKSELNTGIRLMPGMTLAIEPLLAIGSSNTRTLEDNWSVVTTDMSAHEEHTIFIHQDHVEIITKRD